jgi:hypothetical protein
MTRVLYLCPELPFAENGGGKLGMMSDLRMLEANGCDVSVFAMSHPGDPDVSSFPMDRKAVACPVRAGSRGMRFIRGITSGLPHNIERLYPREGFTIVERLVKETSPDLVFIHDFMMAGYVPFLRKLLPSTKFIIRSNNQMFDWSLHLAHDVSPLLRPLALWQHRRWARCEARTLGLCDEHWAVTEKEAIRFRELYGHQQTYYIPISINTDRYTDIPIESGDEFLFGHIGFVEFRRKNDFAAFFTRVWPRIVALQPDKVKCVIAGKFTTHVDLSFLNTTYAGMVPDDRDFFRDIRFALNVQRSPGGIKMKSLVALAAGRVLASTDLGIEGMSIEHGRHYWNLERLAEEGRLNAMFEDPDRNAAMAAAGRAWVVDHHSPQSVQRRVAVALERVLGARELVSSK